MTDTYNKLYKQFLYDATGETTWNTAITTLERNFLSDQLAVGVDEINIPDDWRTWLQDISGISGDDSTADLWYRYLGELGYTGSLRERQRKYFSDGFYLLTQFSGASAAYSLRKLSRSPTDVVRVRRSSDDAEQDFTANEVKNGTLLDFIVPTDVQALYNNAMYFDGVDDWIDLGTRIIDDIINPFKISMTFSTTDTVGISGLMDESDGTGDFWMRVEGSTQIRVLLGDSGEIGTQVLLTLPGNFADGELHSLVLEHTGSVLTLTVDGIHTASGSTTSLSTFATGGNTQIGKVGSNYMSGVIYDVSLEVNGSLVSSYQGYGHTNADWEDQIGSNDGTVNGSPALFTGQGFNGYVSTWYDQTVPTSKDRMYFDGDDYIALDSSITLGNTWTFDLSFVTPDSIPTDNRRLCDTSIYLDDANTISIRVSSTNIDLASGLSLQPNTKYDLRVVCTSNSIDTYLDGVQVGSNVSIPANADDLSEIGSLSGGGSFAWLGSIYDFKVDIGNTGLYDHQWNGYGNTNEDWTDQIGSNNGTVNGSPKRLSVTDYATIANDAIQETTANQPMIVENGALVTENGKPAIKFDGTDDFLINIDSGWEAIEDGDSSFFAVFSKTTYINALAFAIGSTTNEDVDWLIGVSSVVGDCQFRGSNMSSLFSSLGTSGLSIWTAINTSGGNAYVNGSAGTASIGSKSTTSDRLVICSRRDGSSANLETNFSELVIYNSDQSANREAIEKNINRYWKVY